MSNLLVVDVFESYYEGRKTPFPADSADSGTKAQPKRDPGRQGGKPEASVPQAA